MGDEKTDEVDRGADDGFGQRGVRRVAVWPEIWGSRVVEEPVDEVNIVSVDSHAVRRGGREKSMSAEVWMWSNSFFIARFETNKRLGG